MEDILASIRRILAEEEGVPPAVPTSAPGAAPGASPGATSIADGVLQLDASMMLPDPTEASLPPPPVPAPPAFTPPAPLPPEPAAFAPEAPLSFEDAMPAANGSLIGAEAATAAATSVGSLVRTLTAERAAQVYSGGPTIEDIVRAELRPLLKQWLDANLPNMVERLVRAEIERVVGRAVP
jgi:cell pole-organizing protein PopZ